MPGLKMTDFILYDGEKLDDLYAVLRKREELNKSDEQN